MNEAPTFAADTAERSVAENSAAGTNVGDPVTANDEDADDTLTYTISGSASEDSNGSDDSGLERLG